MIIRKCTSYNT